MRHLLARLLTILLLALPAGVIAHPALWVVKDADTTIYLFGTVHLLPNDVGWHFPALEQALERSQSLYIEITDDDKAHMTALVMRYGIGPAHPLSGLLTRKENAALDTAAKTAGVPGGSAALNVMRPWLAALTLSVAPLLKAGLDPAHGVDKQIKALMEQAGKPVHGLETAEQQVRFLADMPLTMQLSFLRQTLRDTENAQSELTALIDAWKDGDTTRLAQLASEDMQQYSPRLYRTLIVKRDKTWARKIASMLKTPGTVFIAVGAAHLAGPDSVQTELRKMNIQAVRL
jgi:uncharacterized protein YbaP (TraB family)